MRRTIPSYPKYEAGVDGHIYRDGKRLLASTNGKGYLRVFLRKEGKTFTVYVHRAVCEAYHGPCPEGMECRHLDNSRDNNKPDNVEWATKVINESDKAKFGTLIKGEDMGHAVLTEAVVNEARDRARRGERIDKIAASYGIKDRVMADAVTGRRWAWLPGAVPAYATRRQLTENEVREVRALVRTMTQKAVADRYGVCRQAIGQIVRRESYAHVA